MLHATAAACCDCHIVGPTQHSQVKHAQVGEGADLQCACGRMAWRGPLWQAFGGTDRHRAQTIDLYLESVSKSGQH